MAVDQTKIHVSLLQSHEVGHIAFVPEQEKIPVPYSHRYALQGIDERNAQVVLCVLRTPSTPGQGVGRRSVQQNLIDPRIDLGVHSRLLDFVVGVV